MSREELRQKLPILITATVALLLYVVAGLRFDNFFSLRVAMNLLNDNAFLGVAAIGLTFVILTGGIDLSVGSMVGCSGIMAAWLMRNTSAHPLLCLGAPLMFGALIGAAHGILVAKFQLPAFLVTLAGLFFCRGVALWISKEAITVDDEFFGSIAGFAVDLPGRSSLSVGALVFLLAVALAAFVARQSRFGRTVYAIGGDMTAATMMGLPVRTALIRAYIASGFCAALGGALFTLYTSSGNAIAGTGLELDAIAAVVIGGTMLSGGYGSVAGTLLGILILGTIQTAITFDGTLSSWWTKIAIGVLLLGFMVVQKVIERATASTLANRQASGA